MPLRAVRTHRTSHTDMSLDLLVQNLYERKGSSAIKLAIIGAIMLRALRHKSLTSTGVLVAMISGVIHALGSHDWLDLSLLIAFFATGTKFTKVKQKFKASLTVVVDQNGKQSIEGPRNHIQVLANSGIASLLIILRAVGIFPDVCRIGVIAQYAAVTADTWSSELGILSASPPILITTLKPCPRGTNGGVSILGLIVAVLGGLMIGILTILLDTSPITGDLTVLQLIGFIFSIGGLGLFGSLIDSLLGALLQSSVVNSSGHIVEADGGIRLQSPPKNVKVISGHCALLSNNQVNLFMAAITSGIAMAAYWNQHQQ